MSVTTNDMQAFLSAEVSDDDPAANGGRPADGTMSLSVKNNAYPDVTSVQRSAGARRRRKIFLANLNAENLSADAPMVIVDRPTVYGDYAWFSPGDFDGRESDLTGAEPIYGAADFAADAASGATTISLALEHAELAAMLEVGREILLSNKADFENMTSSVGVEELRVIADVSVSGLIATVTLSAPLEHDFTVEAGARASVVYRPPAQQARVTDWSGGGASPVVLSNRGTIRQRWTISFTSATTYELAGDTVGGLGTFQVAAQAAPVNPAAWASGAPYLTIPADSLTGHTSGDAVTFYTDPAMTPIWVSNVIPPNVGNYGLTEVGIGWQVESPA